MNWFEIYALFGAPVVALALGILVYFIASRSHTPLKSKQLAEKALWTLASNAASQRGAGELV